MSEVFNEAQGALDGKKTYISAFITALINLLIAFKVVSLDTEQIMAINGVLMAVISVFLRAGVKKAE